MFYNIKPLPSAIEELLAALGASPRLRAHLALVHDVACALTQDISATWPKVAYDRPVVLFGAATHDLGKIVHPPELSGAGHAHEDAGVQLLLDNGVPENLARFARTHGRWQEPECRLEDLLVALSDKIWKGRRDEALEHAIAHRIASSSGEELWSVWLRLDDVLSDIAASADERLLWQARFSVQ